MQLQCQFPHLRDRFWSNGEDNLLGSGTNSAPSSPLKNYDRRGQNLTFLDLKTLSREEGPPTELRARKEKLAYFERRCSRVCEGLYVGAEPVARSREALKECGITHVINCVGFLYPAYFEDDGIAYQVLHLQDTPREDILCVLYDVFDFIRQALSGGGRVLIHCSQGVSRSVTLAVAWIMWTRRACYEEVFEDVKLRRGIANPNIGFVCQLMQWSKRQGLVPSDPARPLPSGVRVLRLAPQSAAVPHYLVGRSASSPGAGCLDPRGSFVVSGPHAVYAWHGQRCSAGHAEAATRLARQLVRYERNVPVLDPEGPPRAPLEAVLVRQGAEPAEFWEGWAPEEAARVAIPRSAFDPDFEMYERGAVPCRAAPESSSEASASPRSDRKTPRGEDAEGPSPNERLRKQARAQDGPAAPQRRRPEGSPDLAAQLPPGREAHEE